MNTKIRIDGLEYEVPTNAAAAIEKEGKRLDAANAKATEAEARADEAAGKLDAVTKERDELKVKLDAALSPERVSDAVKARVSLEASARKVLGPKETFDGKSDAEIKLAVILKSDEEFKADGKSDAYIEGRFDSLVDAAASTNQSRKDFADVVISNRTPKIIAGSERADSPGDEIRIDSAHAARVAAEERMTNAYKQPFQKTTQNN